MIRSRFKTLPAVCLLVSGVAILLAQDSVRDLLRLAIDQLRGGNAQAAVDTATRILTRPGPPDPTALWVRGNALEQLEDYALAARDFALLAQEETQEPRVFMALGSARFKAADMTASIKAFDAAAALDPSLEPQLWQRGIAHYYAGRIDDCIAQFELHRTVNAHDVENSVWHFLCVAERDGFPAARSKLIPVEGDSRVPMREVLALFAGEATPRDVLLAADAAGGADAGFYAHLYLGLYFEAARDASSSAEHIAKAVATKMPRHYMWQVARVHEQLRKAGAPD